MVRSTLDEILPVVTTSPGETEEVGGRLAGLLEAGDVVALYGELGAGKTHLVRGICTALGVPGSRVSSPTFTIVNAYAGRDFPIYHLDAYRAASVAEFFELGYEESFYSGALCLVEWPDRLEELLPDFAILLRLSHLEKICAGSNGCLEWPQAAVEAGIIEQF